MSIVCWCRHWGAGGQQEKNPAAWYYLGRYYVEMKDVAGADTAFTKAVALAPKCAQDVNLWRRKLWVPIINAGVAAWRGGQHRLGHCDLPARQPGVCGRARRIRLPRHPARQQRPARLGRQVLQARRDGGTGPKFAKQKKDAMFNVARVYHVAKRWTDAVPAYTDYLAAYPDDPQATAGLASVYVALGKRDEAMALYARMLQHADAAEASDLFRAGSQIFNGLTPPDTAALGGQCRAQTHSANRALTVRQIAAHCDSTARQALRSFESSVQGQYHIVEQLYEAGLAKVPYDREALFTLAGVAMLAGDTAMALTTAQRLYAVDPLNRGTLRMAAQAWQLGGKPDSTLRYLKLADSLAVRSHGGDIHPERHGCHVEWLADERAVQAKSGVRPHVRVPQRARARWWPPRIST